MIKPDQIPNAVADRMREFFFSRGDAQKAIAAALNAWPGAVWRESGVNGKIVSSRLVLPLTENTNAEA